MNLEWFISFDFVIASMWPYLAFSYPYKNHNWWLEQIVNDVLARTQSTWPRNRVSILQLFLIKYEVAFLFSWPCFFTYFFLTFRIKAVILKLFHCQKLLCTPRQFFQNNQQDQPVNVFFFYFALISKNKISLQQSDTDFYNFFKKMW